MLISLHDGLTLNRDVFGECSHSIALHFVPTLRGYCSIDEQNHDAIIGPFYTDRA
jgi:hypothetical protein